MDTRSGDPAPRARCNASVLRAEARFHLKLLSADDKSIAPVVDECAALGENFAANFARLVLARYLVEHGRHVEAGKLLTAHASEVDRLGYARLIAEYRSLLAELRLRRGDAEGARADAQAVVALAAAVSGSQPLAAAYQTPVDTEQRNGDAAAAPTRHTAGGG